MTTVNQKEYLKKYLGIGKGRGEKKKKKKLKIKSTGLKIIDDDVDVRLNEQIKEDLQGDNEDAPQIVSVIDERPPSLRIDEKTKDKLWMPLGEDGGKPLDMSTIKFEGSMKLLKSSGVHKNHMSNRKVDYSPPRRKQMYSEEVRVKDEACSPERDISSSSKYRDGDSSPVRRIARYSARDSSPVRGNSPDISKVKRERRDSENCSPSHQKNDENDVSPRRPKTTYRNESDNDISPLREKLVVLDSSPPRRPAGVKRNYSDNDISPPRRKLHSEDSSPPRRSGGDRNDSDNDISPPRRRRNNENNSPPRRSKSSKKSDRDMSSPRRKSKDNSPPRRPNHDLSPQRRKNPKNQDCSPIRKKKSRWADNDEPEDKLQQTLDGKKAGLQNAVDLVDQTRKLKQKEDELFINMNAEISGATAATIVRKKNKEVDVEEEERKRKREQENKEKYNRWGKGLKQVEDVNEKIQNELYEMSKPLARYADDADLEKYLKEQEREGDPMLKYLRQKKRKKAVEAGIPMKQQYEGDSAPNRFGIRPGYRWDGVDRSNGYEKKWFEVQNSRAADIEESYKWSTEDM